MAITASAVKELRELTGAGMMDCKKALTETNGDRDKAIEFLREKGLAASAKKAGRIAAEGIVSVCIDGGKGAIVEVNSETDFVAKNDKFRNYVSDVLKQILVSNSTTVEELKEEKWLGDGAETVADSLAAQIAVIGENLNIRRFERFENSNNLMSGYIHGEGRIGVLLEAETDAKDNETVKSLMTDICMQIAAMNPMCVSESDVSEEYIAHEKSVLMAQAINENNQLPEGKRKPEAILEKMLEGRFKKQLKEICLMDQVYVKDGDYTVGSYIQKVAKDVGTEIKINKFVRFETGEGIEKKEENFAAEVAAQMNM